MLQQQHTSIDMGDPSAAAAAKQPEKRLRKRRDLDAMGVSAALAAVKINPPRKGSFPSTSDGDDLGYLVGGGAEGGVFPTSPLSSRRHSTISQACLFSRAEKIKISRHHSNSEC